MNAPIRPLSAVDADAPFSRAELSDEALTAAIWATARFDSSFPGWQLYRRIMTGWSGYDRDLLAWATGCARKLSRAKTVSGRDYLRSDARGPWIALAAGDALCMVIYGRFPANADERGYVRGVRLQTYAKIREPLTACMVRGLEGFRSELHYQYFQVRKAQIDETMPYNGTNKAQIQTVHAGEMHAFRLFGSGNAVTAKEPIHD